MHLSWKHPGGEFEISTDPSRIDIALVHRFLTSSYWAKGIPETTVRRSIEGSLCFGVYCGSRQVGFARVISDCATFAYLADVFIAEEFRGRGLAVWLMQCIVDHVELQGLRRWSLVTRDAHKLYRKFGFRELAAPERWMERHNPDVYASNAPNSRT
jgi:GNAT superfamily N-acetyltransferase